MYLEKFIFINWGNIPNGEFEFGPLNLFSGASGSGKTTAADAIQTVMTAAKNNLFHFNPGQDESTQRGKGGKVVRTLASYVLGCDDGSFARPYMTDGYLVAQFVPNAGEAGDPFCAIVGVRADYEEGNRRSIAKEVDARFYILPFRRSLDIGDFIDAANKKIIPLEKLRSHFQNLFAKSSATSCIEEYTSKKSYLSRLYGALRGQHTALSEREAHHAARAFSRFMAYKPVASINEFVASEILDKKDLGEAIQQISSMMKTIHGMEQEAQRIVAAIERLGAANEQGQAYIEGWLGYNQHDYKLALLQRQKLVKSEQAEQQKRKRIEDSLGDKKSLIQRLDTRMENLQNRNVELLARRKGYKELEQKDLLQGQLKSAESALLAGVQDLLLENQRIENNVEATLEILNYLTKDERRGLSAAEIGKITKAGKVISKNVDWRKTDFQQLLTQDWVEIDPFKQYMTPAQKAENQQNAFYSLLMERKGEVDSIYMRLRRFADQKKDALQKSANKVKLLNSEIERLQRTQAVKLPPAVKEAKQAIEKVYPDISVCPLCDFVSVNEEQWQSAIEGYIGGNRFALIVEPEYEAKAIKVVRQMKGKNVAKVIQGEKAKRDAERLSFDKESIVTVMDFSHATAKAFIEASYGNVLRVDSVDELRMTRRGICADGLGTGNYSLWRCDVDDADLVFGNSARNRALAAKKVLFESTEYEQCVLLDEVNQLNALLETIERLKPIDVIAKVEGIIANYDASSSIRVQLSELDLQKFDEIESSRLEIEEKIKQTRIDADAALKGLGMHEEQLEQNTAQLEKLGQSKKKAEEAVAKLEKQLNPMLSLWSKVDPQNWFEEAADSLTGLDAKKLELEILPQLEKQVDKCRFAFVGAIREHNQESHELEKIVISHELNDRPSHQQFESVCTLQLDIEKVLMQLRSNVLVEKRENINRLKKSFDTTFVDHLCGSIHYSIKEGERVLTELNEELRHHEFGQEKEVYRFGWEFIPEFEEYWQFFEEVRVCGGSDIGSLFDSKLSKKAQKIRDKIVAMLLDNKDETTALRELERIADYRNYRNYEIYKDLPGKAPIALSQYGTGSGGQLETPAYIIRAAAITSAFQFKQAGAHLRLVLVDEAFSKMDETRSRSVLDYLTESLGLQVIFIMPSKASGPFLDMISNQFVFAKYPLAEGESSGQLKSAVYVDRKVFNQEKVKALWQAHRQTIYQQAQFDFMETVLAEEAESNEKASG